MTLDLALFVIAMAGFGLVLIICTGAGIYWAIEGVINRIRSRHTVKVQLTAQVSGYIEGMDRAARATGEHNDGDTSSDR